MQHKQSTENAEYNDIKSHGTNMPLQHNSPEVFREILRCEEKIRGLTHFGRNLCHDINNQLSVIMGFTMLLESAFEEHDIEKFNSCVHSIEEATITGSKITTRAFDMLPRSEHPAIDYHLHDVIRSTIDHVEAIFAPQLAIHVDFDAAQSKIRGDKFAMEMAFHSLLLNAWEAVGKQGIATIATTIEEVANILGGKVRKKLVVRILDTGPGFLPTIRESIFNPFVTTHPNIRHAGFGLASVKAVLKSHHADIMLEDDNTIKIRFDLVDQ